MDLTPQLVPVVFAELYRELRRTCASQLEDRLSEIDRDLDWIDTTIVRYDSMWNYRDGQPVEERFKPVSVEHAQLAAWITAGLRGHGSCLAPAQEIQMRIQARLAGAPRNLVQDHARVTIVAWGLGQVLGDYDRALPAIFCVPLADDSVQLAYEGLAKHLLDMPMDDDWPEMLGSSILWRACGLADGLRPQTPRLNLEASVNQLVAEMRPIVDQALLRTWTREWTDYRHVRDGFTHVVAGERGRYCFADVAPKMRCRDDVAVALASVTNFVGHQIALQLQDEVPTPWKVMADSLGWELDMWGDMASE